MKSVDRNVTHGKHVEIGEQTIVKGNVRISDNVRIGNYCLISGTESQETVIGEDVVIQDFTTIHPGVRILPESKIGSYVTLGHITKLASVGDVSFYSDRVKDFIVPEPKTILGKGTLIRSYSTIYTNVITGRLITGHYVVIREHTTLEDDCLVGTGSIIQGYCRVGSKTQIGESCDISQSVRIGKGVFLGGHSILSDNKKMVRDVRYDLYGPIIEDFVRVGINCMILADVTIGKNSVIGAASVVTKSIPKSSLAYGSPTRIVRKLTEEEIREYVSSIRPCKSCKKVSD